MDLDEVLEQLLNSDEASGVEIVGAHIPKDFSDAQRSAYLRSFLSNAAKGHYSFDSRRAESNLSESRLIAAPTFPWLREKCDQQIREILEKHIGVADRLAFSARLKALQGAVFDRPS